MNKNQIFWLIFWLCAFVTIFTFALSSLIYVLKVISAGFLTIVLGMLSYKTFKRYKKYKVSNTHSGDIDELLNSDEEIKEKSQKKKLTFSERTENFSNGLLPYALVFFTFCAFGLFIALISM